MSLLPSLWLARATLRGVWGVCVAKTLDCWFAEDDLGRRADPDLRGASRVGSRGRRRRERRARRELPLGRARRRDARARLPARGLRGRHDALPGHLLPARPARRRDDLRGEQVARRRRSPQVGKPAILVEPQGARDKDSDAEYLNWGPGRNWENYVSRRARRLHRRALPDDRLAPGPRARRSLGRRLRRGHPRHPPPRPLRRDRVVVGLLPPDRPDRHDRARPGLGRRRARPDRVAEGAGVEAADLPRVLRRPRRHALPRRERPVRPRADRRARAAPLRGLSRRAQRRACGTPTPRAGSRRRCATSRRPQPILNRAAARAQCVRVVQRASMIAWRAPAPTRVALVGLARGRRSPLVGLAGVYRYADNFWLYRGFAPPKDAPVRADEGDHRAALRREPGARRPPPAGRRLPPARLLHPPGSALPRALPPARRPGPPGGVPARPCGWASSRTSSSAVRKAQPLILVMPFGSTGSFTDEEWANGVRPGNGWETFVARDLVEAIDARYRTIRSRRRPRARRALRGRLRRAQHRPPPSARVPRDRELVGLRARPPTSARSSATERSLLVGEHAARHARARRARPSGGGTSTSGSTAAPTTSSGSRTRRSPGRSTPRDVAHRFFLVRGGHNWALWRGNAARAYLVASEALCVEPPPRRSSCSSRRLRRAGSTWCARAARAADRRGAAARRAVAPLVGAARVLPARLGRDRARPRRRASLGARRAADRGAPARARRRAVGLPHRRPLDRGRQADPGARRARHRRPRPRRLPRGRARRARRCAGDRSRGSAEAVGRWWSPGSSRRPAR